MNIKKFIKLIIIILLIYVIFSYAKVEYLTYYYGCEFDNKEYYAGHFQDISLIKVFEYKDDYAKVYYESKNEGYGQLAIFRKNSDGDFTLERMGVKAWSRHGSADDFIWPYYFH